MQAINQITGKFEAAGISYCLVGGLAAIAYGRPRLTLDADLVLALRPDHIPALVQAFPIEDFYLPPGEVLLAEVQRESRGHFNIIHQHSALRADCYLPGKSKLALWELEHRRKLTGPFGSEWFAPPESVILHKLLFFREGGSQKHLEDIGAILDAGAVPDRNILLQWIDELGLQKEWDLIKGGWKQETEFF
jgi:hypothetical protein